MDIKTRTRRSEIVVQVLKKLFPVATCALHYHKDYELLIAVILSAQCTDKKVNEVTERLFKKYPELSDYTHADFDEFCQDIRSTGFYKNKAKNVLSTTTTLFSQFGGKVPNTMKELLTLDGVARKTANVVMGELFNKAEGIAVDTHVMRLSQKYKLTENTHQDKIEKDLMEIIPQEEWREFTLRMIDYGREFSPAHKVTSDEDPISLALIAENLL